MEKSFEIIYEDELNKLEVSMNEYIESNNSRGVSQMRGRRFGNMWERFVKTAFEISEKSTVEDKVFYKDYLDKWIENKLGNIRKECCKKNAEKLLMDYLDESPITDEQDMCDFTFDYQGQKYAVDTKYCFHSNDAKTVREISSSASHLSYLGYIPVLLIRTKREESIESALNRFENEGWRIVCDKDATDFISKYAGNELCVWIEENVDVWGRLKSFHKGMQKLRFGEKDYWSF